MGKMYDAKHPYRRPCLKRIRAKRRQLLRITQEALVNTGDESVKRSTSVETLFSATDSEVSNDQSLSKPAQKGTCKNVECEDDTTLVIEKSLPDTNRIQKHVIEGKRIVDINHFLNEMHRIFNNHIRGIECQFKDWILINSRRHGLLTQFFFKCQMCNFEDNFWSESVNSNILDINTAAVGGTITMGIGYAQLKELCTAMNIPCMSEPTYIKIREILVDEFQETATETATSLLWQMVVG